MTYSAAASGAREAREAEAAQESGDSEEAREAAEEAREAAEESREAAEESREDRDARVSRGSASMPVGEVYLDDTWALWFHDPNDADWTNASYTQIATISSANNFWAVQSLLSDKVKCGMFFLMRDHVFPCWDDPYNAKGGCLSVKVSNQDATGFWETICALMLSENLVKKSDGSHAADGGHQVGPRPNEHVNGLSVTPKNAFCVFKLWISENAPKDPCRYVIPDFSGQVMFRSHASCMVEASTKAIKPPPARSKGDRG